MVMEKMSEKWAKENILYGVTSSGQGQWEREATVTFPSRFIFFFVVVVIGVDVIVFIVFGVVIVVVIGGDAWQNWICLSSLLRQHFHVCCVNVMLGNVQLIRRLIGNPSISLIIVIIVFTRPFLKRIANVFLSIGWEICQREVLKSVWWLLFVFTQPFF